MPRAGGREGETEKRVRDWCHRVPVSCRLSLSRHCAPSSFHSRGFDQVFCCSRSSSVCKDGDRKESRAQRALLCCLFLADRIRKSLGHFVTRSRERAVGEGSGGEREAESDCQKYSAVQTFMLYMYLFAGQIRAHCFHSADARAGDDGSSSGGGGGGGGGRPFRQHLAVGHWIHAREQRLSPSPLESQVLTAIHPITETSQM